MCPAQAILEAGGRCLLCCRRTVEVDETTEAMAQQDCCNCTETRGGSVCGPSTRRLTSTYSSNLLHLGRDEEESVANLGHKLVVEWFVCDV